MNPHNTTPENEARHRRQEWLIGIWAVIVIAGAVFAAVQLGAMLLGDLLDLVFPSL